nr:MAG TPA: hypothetical protein [Caudoviricetes sp.]
MRLGRMYVREGCEPARAQASIARPKALIRL